MKQAVETVRILLLSMAAAVAYGLLQDQITVRICAEYFSVAHPPLFSTDDPTLLALGWGVLATWWVGLLLGVPLAFVARFGSRPNINARNLVKPLAILMGSVAVFALLAGVTGFALAQSGALRIVGWLATAVPPDKHAAFLGDAWAHTAAYAAGFVGGFGLSMWIWRRRNAGGGL